MSETGVINRVIVVAKQDIAVEARVKDDVGMFFQCTQHTCHLKYDRKRASHREAAQRHHMRE